MDKLTEISVFVNDFLANVYEKIFRIRHKKNGRNQQYVIINGDDYGPFKKNDTIVIHIHGSVEGSVIAHGDIIVDGDVGGKVDAGDSVKIGKNAYKNIDAGDGVIVLGNVAGNVDAGDSIKVGGSVSGKMSAGDSIKIS